ncbi:hypothetical protein [Collinsella intestinalis]|nr:hypothetical protein [Collinsella intestinalis]
MSIDVDMPPAHAKRTLIVCPLYTVRRAPSHGLPTPLPPQEGGTRR